LCRRSGRKRRCAALAALPRPHDEFARYALPELSGCRAALCHVVIASGQGFSGGLENRVGLRTGCGWAAVDMHTAVLLSTVEQCRSEVMKRFCKSRVAANDRASIAALKHALAAGRQAHMPRVMPPACCPPHQTLLNLAADVSKVAERCAPSMCTAPHPAHGPASCTMWWQQELGNAHCICKQRPQLQFTSLSCHGQRLRALRLAAPSSLRLAVRLCAHAARHHALRPPLRVEPIVLHH
jgi:hypothetical protein